MSPPASTLQVYRGNTFLFGYSFFRDPPKSRVSFTGGRSPLLSERGRHSPSGSQGERRRGCRERGREQGRRAKCKDDTALHERFVVGRWQGRVNAGAPSRLLTRPRASVLLCVSSQRYNTVDDLALARLQHTTRCSPAVPRSFRRRAPPSSHPTSLRAHFCCAARSPAITFIRPTTRLAGSALPCIKARATWSTLISVMALRALARRVAAPGARTHFLYRVSDTLSLNASRPVACSTRATSALSLALGSPSKLGSRRAQSPPFNVHLVVLRGPLHYNRAQSPTTFEKGSLNPFR